MASAAEIVPNQNRDVEKKEFASRERFLTEFGGFVEALVEANAALSEDSLDFPGFRSEIRESLERIRQTFEPEETEIFEAFWRLFRLKQESLLLPTLRKLFKGEGSLEQTTIEIAGPIASGKSTLATALAGEIDAQGTSEDFGPEGNPFLTLAYKDSGLMFRTQLKFLSESINAGLDAKLQKDRRVRDMSAWADSLVYEEWRFRSGVISPEEHRVYRQLFSLFADSDKPLIAKPDLLIMIEPGSLEGLWEGFKNRLEADWDEREMERDLTKNDLKIACEAAQDAVQILREEHKLNVLELKVDPVAVYEDGDLRYAVIHEVRERLRLLGEMIQPPLEEVISEIKNFIAWKSGRLVYVCSPSMFTGKTTILVELRRQIGESMQIFQPAKSLRYSEGDVVKTLDGDQVPGITIESNKLEDILAYVVKEKINPEETPVLAIDELMLFENSAVEAVRVIKELREMGFNVIVTGLALSYKGEPFRFMDVFAYWVEQDPEALKTVVSTCCRYCGERAQVTRLRSPDGNLAPYKGDVVVVGHENFSPVCGLKHPSCEGRPEPFEGFEANLKPREKDYYIKILEDAGVNLGENP